VGGDRVGVCAPDLVETPGVTLVDPRHPRERIEAVARDLGLAGIEGTIEVFDPSLLPDTVERDALASFGVALLQRISTYRLNSFGRAFLAEMLALADSIEVALREGQPLGPCYDGIRSLADRTPTFEIVHGVPFDMKTPLETPVRMARTFLSLHRDLPPPAEEPMPVDEADADDISRAFQP
jgi:hypothetical protein